MLVNAARRCVGLPSQQNLSSSPPTHTHQIVRITDATLRLRLAEFGSTEASQLTPEEFESMEIVRNVCCCMGPSSC